jgi:hypothetical protein
MATLTYEELGLVPIKDFDYRTYDKVNLLIFRIGADIVEVVIQVILRKDLGAPKPYVQFIT